MSCRINSVADFMSCHGTALMSCRCGVVGPGLGKQFSYTGASVVGKSITATYVIPTDGTEPTVTVAFN